MTRIIAGFPGVGKTHAAKVIKGLTIHDLDSSSYSKLDNGEKNHSFAQDYLQAIKDSFGKVNIIFISTHKEIREALQREGLIYELVYPMEHHKDLYMKRYNTRGDSAQFMAFMEENFDKFVGELQEDSFPLIKKALTKDETMMSYLLKIPQSDLSVAYHMPNMAKNYASVTAEDHGFKLATPAPTLESSIKDVIAAKLSDGTVEKLIEEEMERGIQKSLQNIFSSYGDVTKIVEKKVKEVMVPYLEEFDYSSYIVKLDEVLTQILKETALPNKDILKNFQKMMTLPKKDEPVKTSELFDHYVKFVAENVETDGLGIDYDDTPSYECVEVTMEVVEEDTPSWSTRKQGSIVFECKHDENMNIHIPIHGWTDLNPGLWYMDYQKESGNVASLRHLNAMDIFLLSLKQQNVKLEIDVYDESDEVRPEAEPELSY